MRRRRVLKSEKLLGLTHRCPECGRMMRSTGEALHDDGVEGWYVGFYCDNDGEHFAIFTPALQGILDEITRGVDPATLPFWSAAGGK